MACVDLPLPTIPALPFGDASLGIGLPAFTGDLALCCKILHFSLPPIPVVLAVPMNASVITAINAAIASINAYHDALSFNCPLE